MRESTNELARTRFESHEIEAFEPTAKIALLATLNRDQAPHITLISTLCAISPEKLAWGQFTAGMSKQHVLERPEVGFLIMTLDRRIWMGSARYTHRATHGAEHRMFNDKPMFRYNSYFGIHTAHYMDLVHVSGGAGINLTRVVTASVLTEILRTGRRRSDRPALTPWAHKLINRPDSLAFLSYKGDTGFPQIHPVLQCRAAGRGRLVFTAPRDLCRALSGAVDDRVSVMALSQDMESVLVGGRLSSSQGRGALRLSTMEIDWVYNSMPPKQGMIYPLEPLTAVRNFQ
jgi:hypothetical protein